MRACGRIREVSAYHDGELSHDDARALEEHLAGCPDCARELAELRALSGLLCLARTADVPPGVLVRLHERADLVRQRGVLMLARRLAAVAAVILVALSIWVAAGTERRDRAALAINAWELAATSPNTETAATETDRLARWIVEDLSQEATHE
jgi:anti-sigma factor RsiW